MTFKSIVKGILSMFAKALFALMSFFCYSVSLQPALYWTRRRCRNGRRSGRYGGVG